MIFYDIISLGIGNSFHVNRLWDRHSRFFSIALNKVALRNDSDMFTFTLRYRLHERERATTMAIVIVWIVIAIKGAIEKRSLKSMFKTDRKKKAKGLRETTFAFAKWKSGNYMESNR